MSAQSRKHVYLKTATPEERRQAAVRRLAESLAETPNGCLVRTRSCGANGYSRITVDGVQTYAHRFAWESANGRPVPEGMVVMHRCDNPPCCNPEHLEIGTLTDNNRDMFQKGRGCVVQPPAWRKVSPDALKDIIREFRAGASKPELAEKHGVTRQAIQYLLKREGEA